MFGCLGAYNPIKSSNNPWIWQTDSKRMAQTPPTRTSSVMGLLVLACGACMDSIELIVGV